MVWEELKKYALEHNYIEFKDRFGFILTNGKYSFYSDGSVYVSDSEVAGEIRICYNRTIQQMYQLMLALED